MKFWDMMSLFHDRVSKDYPNGKEGRAAVRLIRELIEPGWKEQGSDHHPLRQLVGIASERSYRAIIEHANKLRAISVIPGFEFVRPRIGDPDEYLGAWAEMEVALMLKLEGFDVAFLGPGQTPSPDLLVQGGGSRFMVEVGSLHPPDEDRRLMNAANIAMFAGITKAFSGGIVTGGIISRPPSDAELARLDREVKASVDRSFDRRQMERVNLPGVATIYMAPRDLAALLPEDCRGQFRFVPLYRRQPEEKITRTIRSKQRQLDEVGSPVLLFLFDRVLGSEVLKGLFDKTDDDVEAVLSTIHSVSALLVVAPRMGSEPTSPCKTTKGDKVLMSVQIGSEEWADVLIWKNRHGDEKMPSTIGDCFEGYYPRICGLPASQRQGAGSLTAANSVRSATD